MATRINKTVELMTSMKLPIMAEEYLKQLKDPKYENFSFEERLFDLLSKENDSRINHTIEKHIKGARFSISGANFNELNKDPDRKLPLELIEALKTNDYIRNGLSITIVGATGTGKSWLACAYGMNACKDKFKVKYYRLPELMSDLEAARIQGRYRSYIKTIDKCDLLIIDDFLLHEASETERNDILEILETRTNKKSTIFCSQFSKEGWHNRLGSGPVADAILDRIDNSSYHIYLQGKSLRETYSKVNK